MNFPPFSEQLCRKGFVEFYVMKVTQRYLQASQVKREDGSPEDYDNWTVMTSLLDAEKQKKSILDMYKQT